MFFSRNKKNNVYPCKPQFYYIKVGFKGSKLYRYVFVMDLNTYCEYSAYTRRLSSQNIFKCQKIWAAKWESVPSDICANRKLKTACASALWHSLIRVFAIRMRKLCILGYPKCAQWRVWSHCTNAQAYMNLRCVCVWGGGDGGGGAHLRMSYSDVAAFIIWRSHHRQVSEIAHGDVFSSSLTGIISLLP